MDSKSYQLSAEPATRTALNNVPSIPRCDNAPVFNEPWEAEAFAITLALHRAGVFTWQQWADTLSAAIKRAQDRGDPDLGDTYYRHWLDALETIVVAQGVAERSTLSNLAAAWQSAAEATPHGAPIELEQHTLAQLID